MKTIPAAALVPALIGLAPFLWGAAMALAPDPAALAPMRVLPAALRSEYVLITYATLVLYFMSGVLWGFAARAAPRRAAIGCTAAAIPVLWTFLRLGGAYYYDLSVLIPGFLGLLALGWGFRRAGLAPAWWTRLQVPVLGVALACLTIGVLV